jgi:BirA family biotin operon repressor/biotin-[acetyl-CoA-carboxylase] ligase
VNDLDIREVEAGIAGTRFSGSIVHLRSVGSTNTLALEAAQSGATNGVWVADEQTAGRGRGGHSWHSVAGDGLYVSALVTPKLPMRLALWISLATGLAVKQAVAEETGVNADIRWPNDLLADGKKFGGILVETAITPANTGGTEASLRHGVIGIGINLTHRAFPEAIQAVATSLSLAGGRPVRRGSLLMKLLQSLDRELVLLEREGGSGLLERFSAGSSWVRGKRVRVEEAGGYEGVTAGLDAQGFLQVDGEDGVRRTVLSGGVRDLG